MGKVGGFTVSIVSLFTLLLSGRHDYMYDMSRMKNLYYEAYRGKDRDEDDGLGDDEINGPASNKELVKARIMRRQGLFMGYMPYVLLSYGH